MVDPILFLAMHRDLQKSDKKSSVKNQFELAFDHSIKKAVDERLELEKSENATLVPLPVRRAQLENELRDSYHLPQFERYMNTAVGVFKKEGKRYLSSQEFELLIRALDQIYNRLEKLTLEDISNGEYKEALKIDGGVQSSIFRMGVAKFDESCFFDSLSIFSFLALVAPDNFDHWYRLGLVAQECDYYDLALSSYKQASLLAPDFIGSYVFIVDCYIRIGNADEAMAVLDELKNKVKENQGVTEWQEQIKHLENLILCTPRR